jgi:hypothetical protein
MTSLVSTLIGVAFLLLAWRCWQRTMLDDTRDRLFDLRDGLRDDFAARPVACKILFILNCGSL